MTLNDIRDALTLLLVREQRWRRGVNVNLTSETEMARLTIDMLFEHLGVRQIDAEGPVRAETCLQDVWCQLRPMIGHEVARAAVPTLTALPETRTDKMFGTRRYRASILAITTAPDMD